MLQNMHLLTFGDEAVGRGNEELDPVSVLAVCQMVEQMTHLAGQTEQIISFIITLILD